MNATTLTRLRMLQREEDARRRLLRLRLADVDRLIARAADGYALVEWDEDHGGRHAHPHRYGTHLPELARWVRVRRDLLSALEAPR